MSQENYIQILIESLENKVELLQMIQKQNDIQSEILSAEEFDNDAFESTIDEKDKLITRLRFIDTGFDAVYNRIKNELQSNKNQHKDEIKKLQSLITEITDLSTNIQASEKRNDLNLKNRFTGERHKVKQSKATVKAVTGYYQNMTRTNVVDAQYMDSKK